MLDGPDESLAAATDRWLSDFERALGAADAASLAALFHSDSHWRDLLAFTWHVQTLSGAATIANALTAHAAGTQASRFERAPGRTPPRLVTRAGTEATARVSIESIIDPR